MAFQCTIVTPENQVFDSTVTQVILPAHDGQIGILTGRAPLLAKIGLGQLRIDLPNNGGSKYYFVDGGVAQMKDDQLVILTDQAVAAADLDATSARAEYAEAEARKATDAASIQQRQHRMAAAKAKQELAGKR